MTAGREGEGIKTEVLSVPRTAVTFGLFSLFAIAKS